VRKLPNGGAVCKDQNCKAEPAALPNCHVHHQSCVLDYSKCFFWSCMRSIRSLGRAECLLGNKTEDHLTFTVNTNAVVHVQRDEAGEMSAQLMDSEPPPTTFDQPFKAEAIFREACEQFKASLSDQQLRSFQEFPDAESMLISVHEEVKRHPLQKSILTRCCGQVNGLSSKLSPFFKVVDLFVSSNPTFAAVAWGSIRLVFVVRCSA
jgi:hypothetical protein